MSSYTPLFFRQALPAFVISLSLTACGGGGGSGGTAASGANTSATPSEALAGNADAPSSTTAPDDGSGKVPVKQPDIGSAQQAITIDYYGDSTIWGYASGTGERVATSAPAAFAAALPNSARYTVRNEGVNSSDACQLLNGQDGKHPAWDAQLASSEADVVIINHAINDQWRMDVNTYKSCLTSLAVKAKTHGKKIIFETPNPTRDAGANSLGVYVNAMKAVATQQDAPVIDQYTYLLDYLNGQSPYTICPDGLHSSDAVYVMKGKYAASTFVAITDR